MKIRLPQYSSNDNYIMLFVMLPLTLVLNSILFGKLYFSSITIFTLATLISGTGACIDFIICGYIAVALKKRFPLEKQVAKRLTLMILAFFIVTGLFLYTLFHGYEAIHFYGYRFYEAGFIWCYVAMGIMNIFITLIQEGASRYEDWKKNMEETDALKASFRQSQLQGLKSQVNPHFLFNSLNSLSSLIYEDEEKAETFLNEMSKVYRYMLRNDEDQFVTLQTELAFVQSYMYLLKARYGDGLVLEKKVSNEDLTRLIPPLTLQVIIENAIYQNAIIKNKPLVISIETVNDGFITVSNNVQPKIVTEPLDQEAGLDNLVKKYLLLSQSELLIQEQEDFRSIRLPLIIDKKEDQ
ncbi:MAG: sensor histidine kinase [Bacteroidetes bacterium]|nr:sensor histidine kinase [Bacteroidota bacterium]